MNFLNFFHFLFHPLHNHLDWMFVESFNNKKELLGLVLIYGPIQSYDYFVCYSVFITSSSLVFPPPLFVILFNIWLN